MAAPVSEPVCPEKQLLVCCSRTRLDPPAAEELRRLLGLPLDWDFILSAAAEHGVAPLLLRNLSSVGLNAVPAAQLAAVKDHVRRASVRALVLTAELIRVLDVLSAAAIQAIPYKGPVLAAQAYGDIALREFEDIDLVLRQRDVAAADRLLPAVGYSREFPPVFAPGQSAPLIPGEYNYRDSERRLMVELHTERTFRHFPAPPDLDALALRLAPVCLSGHDIPTFSIEDTLVFLCVHGAKDFWQRIVWVADVVELIRSHPRIDWDRAFAFADAVRARRILHLGLALADRLFQISMPDEIRSRIRADSTAGSVAAQMQRSLLGRTALPLGARATFDYRRYMLPGTLAGIRYAFRLATVPAAEDWQSIRLPRPLAPLYAALRPLRLLKKYGGSKQVSAGPPS
jgi:Uncharacterised nucleotidyltransferase